MIEVIGWSQGSVRILDQTRLPRETIYLELHDLGQLVEAIKALRVRGAPAIGIAAAYGIALAFHGKSFRNQAALLDFFDTVAQELLASRPTAVNLGWAVRRMRRLAEALEEVDAPGPVFLEEARRIHQETVEADRRMAVFGAELVPPGATVLTHCNTGSLATGGYGTALGVIREAAVQGKVAHVIATETRPLLQGARLTAWELSQDHIPFTLITDSMAGYLMAQKKITCVLVGADRIAANGDTANKIGTYTLAVLAKAHRVPFYVAAPMSTIDFATRNGRGIPIEERKAEEVTRFGGVPTAPEGVQVTNPAFDVTPARLISAIITDRGVARRPYRTSLLTL
jgi:methylthioribose-1-phosphate isomerase